MTRTKRILALTGASAAFLVPLGMAAPAQAATINGTNGTPCADVAEDVGYNTQTGQLTIGRLVVFYGVGACLN